METKKVKSIRIRRKMSDPKGFLLPRGRIAELNIEIVDGLAKFWFLDRKITKMFSRFIIELEKQKGKNDSVYFEKLNCMLSKYPNQTKEEIAELLLKQMEQMGKNYKNDRSK